MRNYFVILLLSWLIISCSSQKDKGYPMSQKIDILAYELQEDPQQFGKNLLLLQQQLAVNQNSPSLQQKLVDYLFVIKWLESPNSH